MKYIFSALLFLHGAIHLMGFAKATTRLFFMKAVMKGLPVSGLHSFKNGVAFMDIRLLSLFKVQFQSGKEMGIAETVTFF